MKKLYFLVILFFAASCVKEDEAIDNPNIQQPVPEGAKEVIIIVDEGYDLTHTKALSLMGSSVMSGDTNKIAIPASFESATFFLQEETDEVLALVRTSPSNTTITVNGSTVSQALMTLVPAYHSMSKTSRDKFEREIISIPLYIDFVVIVDKLLKEGKPIYSTDLEFTNKLVELNAYINANYLETSDQRGSTLNYLEEKIYDKQQNEGDLNFSDWMTRENGGTVTNKVHSYVRVELEALSGGEMVASLLKPEPFGTGKTQLSLSTLNLKDNCYNVFLTQSHSDAISQNVLGAATTFADLFLNIVFGYMPGQGRNACIADIAGSVITDISTSVMQTANLSTWEMVDKTGMVAWGGIKTAATSTNCMKTFTNVATILNALGQQSAAILKVMQVLNYAQQSVEVTSYLIAIAKPLELNEIIQLYYRDLKEACIKVIDDKTLKEEYAPGEVIYPGIKLEAQSQYAEWIRSGFKVKWIAETGNGTTNLTESATNNEGKATIGWTLPDNLSGEVTLKAEILDKEGDHLEGSPIKFSTKVLPCVSSGYQLQIGTYSSDYISSSVLQTYEQGASMILPNYMKQMIRLTYNGVPVRSGRATQWEDHLFGSIPMSPADVHINDYQLSLWDYTNDRSVCFEVDLLLTNDAYERIVDKAITISRFMNYGEVYYDNLYTVVFRSDKTYIQKTGGTEKIYNYNFNWDYNFRTQPCLTSEITKPIIGVIQLHTELGNGFWPNFIIVYEDGSLSSNGPQACTDWFDYFVIQ